jgi:hypothetical protein
VETVDGEPRKGITPRSAKTRRRQTLSKERLQMAVFRLFVILFAYVRFALLIAVISLEGLMDSVPSNVQLSLASSTSSRRSV